MRPCRKRRDAQRPRFEHHSLEHVLSFQRRVHALKKHFFRRGEKTPLGRLRDWWDRTEAQMRAALHAHILCWFARRDVAARDARLCREDRLYTPLPPVERTAPGVGPKQRPAAQRANWAKYQHVEDNLYHSFEMGRVTAEMFRPHVEALALSFPRWDADTLQMAGLVRAVQSRLYLHSCSPKYCLKNRTTCRFMFPWPLQPYQCYDENCERVSTLSGFWFALRLALSCNDVCWVRHPPQTKNRGGFAAAARRR